MLGIVREGNEIVSQLICRRMTNPIASWRQGVIFDGRQNTIRGGIAGGSGSGI